jgi:hypothetical protein
MNKFGDLMDRRQLSCQSVKQVDPVKVNRFVWLSLDVVCFISWCDVRTVQINMSAA